MIGRPTLSEAEKKLKGTLQPCRVNKAAPKTKKLDEYAPIARLDAMAKKIWTRTVDFLKENDMMGAVDVDMLTAYCWELSSYIHHTKTALQQEKDNDKAKKEIMSMDDVDILSKLDALNNLPRPDRWYRMAGNAFEKAIKISDRYGFTPASRQKLNIGKVEEEEDELMKFLDPQFKSQSQVNAQA